MIVVTRRYYMAFAVLLSVSTAAAHSSEQDLLGFDFDEERTLMTDWLMAENASQYGNVLSSSDGVDRSLFFRIGAVTYEFIVREDEQGDISRCSISRSALQDDGTSSNWLASDVACDGSVDSTSEGTVNPEHQSQYEELVVLTSIQFRNWFDIWYSPALEERVSELVSIGKSGRIEYVETELIPVIDPFTSGGAVGLLMRSDDLGVQSIILSSDSTNGRMVQIRQRGTTLQFRDFFGGGPGNGDFYQTRIDPTEESGGWQLANDQQQSVGTLVYGTAAAILEAYSAIEVRH